MKVFVLNSRKLKVSGGKLTYGQNRFLKLSEVELIGLLTPVENLNSLKLEAEKRGIFLFYLLPGREVEVLSIPSLPEFKLPPFSNYTLLELKLFEIVKALRLLGRVLKSKREADYLIKQATFYFKGIEDTPLERLFKELNKRLNSYLSLFLFPKLERAPLNAPPQEKVELYLSLTSYLRELTKGLLGFVLLKEGVKPEVELLIKLTYLLEPSISFKGAYFLFSSFLKREYFRSLKGGGYLLKKEALVPLFKSYLEGFYSTSTLYPVLKFLRRKF